MQRSILAAGLVCCAGFSWTLSAGAADPAVPKTVMAECGSLLFADDFSKPLGDQWNVAKGKWDVGDGAIKVAELKADTHGAVARHAVEFSNAVFQYSFKFDGAKSTSLSINGAKGHVCRVLMTPSQLKLQKDDSDHAGPDKAAVLGTQDVSLADGKWHTVVVEVAGAEFLARIDDRAPIFGQHAAIDVAKTNIGLTVGGEHVSFKNLRVWNATPKADWPAAKAKLVTASK